MMFEQTFNGTFQDVAKGKSLHTSGFAYFCLIVEGYASHKADRQLRGVVGGNIITQELTEMVNHQTTQFRLVKMTGDKWRQRSQETVGHRLSMTSLMVKDISCSKASRRCWGSRPL